MPRQTGGSAARTPRRTDPAKLRAALIAQWHTVAGVTDALSPAQLAAPSGLPGWTVAHLTAHLALGIEAVPRWLAQPEPPAAGLVSLDDWAAGVAAHAGAIGDLAIDSARNDPEAARPSHHLPAAERALAAAPDDRRTRTRVAPMTLPDMLATRLLEAVVHADDLERATGAAFPHDRGALAVAVRTLAAILASRAPGHTVEVRIPPYAAVQCVTGPKHTRGVPPNVVETDPKTWIRLATGRLTWEDAVEDGRVHASGERSDLSGLLPLLG